MRTDRSAVLMIGLGLALLALLLVSLGVGYGALSPSRILHGLFAPETDPAAVIVREIRLPRLLLAVIVGAALGISGAALQGLLHNPLAEPGLTGVSSTAALGAVIALYFGFAAEFPWSLPAAAMIGAGLAATAQTALALRGVGSLTLILAGAAISGWSVSLTSLAMNLSPNPYALSELVTWLLGSVRDRSMDDVFLCLPFVIGGSITLWLCRRGLDALTLGPETAASLGVDLTRLRIAVILGTAAAVGSTVAVAGSIGFVGLVVPHLLRPVFGPRPGGLLLPSALGGGFLVLAADTAARMIPVGPETQLGVLTSLLGAPFFLALILRLGREER